MAGFLFRNDDGPRYLSGHLTLVGMTTLTASFSAFLSWYLRQENARRDCEFKPPDEYSIEEKMYESDKGDNATFFRYTT